MSILKFMDSANSGYRVEVRYDFSSEMHRRDSEGILGFLGQHGIRFTLKQKDPGTPVLLDMGFQQYSYERLQADSELVLNDLRKINDKMWPHH